MSTERTQDRFSEKRSSPYTSKSLKAIERQLEVLQGHILKANQLAKT